MKIIDKVTYTSPVSVDNGYTNEYQGEHEQTMELIENPAGELMIEWDIPEMEETIAMCIEREGMTVTGYDGVFELPPQAIALLEKNGYNCDEVKEPINL